MGSASRRRWRPIEPAHGGHPEERSGARLRGAELGEDEQPSPRQLEILWLLGAGRRRADAAAALGITPGTVATHLARVYTTLRARNSAQAFAIAWRRHLFDRRY